MIKIRFIFGVSVSAELPAWLVIGKDNRPRRFFKSWRIQAGALHTRCFWNDK